MPSHVSSPDALGVERNLPGGVAGATFHPPVAPARTVPNPQDGPEESGIARVTVFAPARAELLHVLMLPDFERADRIGEFWSNPQSRDLRRAPDRLRGGPDAPGGARRDAARAGTGTVGASEARAARRRRFRRVTWSFDRAPPSYSGKRAEARHVPEPCPCCDAIGVPRRRPYVTSQLAGCGWSIRGLPSIGTLKNTTPSSTGWLVSFRPT